MSKSVKIGNIYIGGGRVPAVQSMSTFKPSDVDNAINQALSVERLGCDIFRYFPHAYLYKM